MINRKQASCSQLIMILIIATWVSNVVAEETSCPVEFKHKQALFQDFSFDTGWVPDPNAPIRVRFYFHAGGGVDATLTGDAFMSWPERFGLTYIGHEQGGEFVMDMGVDMSADIAWDLPLIGSGQAPLPIVPQFDLIFDDTAVFTPFLLEGSEDSPVRAEDEIQKTQLAFIDLVPIITGGTPVPGFKAGLKIFAGGEFKGDLSGDQIATTPLRGEEVVQTIEEEIVDWPDDGEIEQQGEAVYDATAHLKATIVITPGISVVIGEPPIFNWNMAPIDIPVPIVNRDFHWRFAPETVEFQVPIPEDEPDAGVDAGTDTEDTDSDTGETETDTGETETNTGDTDIEWDAGIEPDSGVQNDDTGSCGCSTAGRHGRGSSSIFQLILILLG
ncbi:MAG: hypothetical protein GY854_25675 [Deltaproteobacteria bacterium]|nr:hypothetical protein [Deltaproteobacteria bacterium]